MAMVTLENTKLELRRDEKGRFKLFFDGQYVPGVMRVDVAQQHAGRPEFTITFGSSCVRVIENVPAPVPEWRSHDGSEICPVAQLAHVECESDDCRWTGYAGGIKWENVKRYRVTA
ncbi:hypothetical protein [Ensifer aridi]|uniref:hypothetical protein n=1 Tax=Ensifer aridi TaxID=1708715 RepID=UPI000A110E4F|nr:hypothetical protein [Ensifer aridi]